MGICKLPKIAQKAWIASQSLTKPANTGGGALDYIRAGEGGGVGADPVRVLIPERPWLVFSADPDDDSNTGKGRKVVQSGCAAAAYSDDIPPRVHSWGPHSYPATSFFSNDYAMSVLSSTSRTWRTHSIPLCVKINGTTCNYRFFHLPSLFCSFKSIDRASNRCSN